MFSPRDLSAPNCREDFELARPYTTQCASLIFRAMPKGHQFRYEVLDACGGYPQLTLAGINEAMEGLPGVLVAGPDSANPGFPQTLANLKKWKDRSAIARIYYEAADLVAGYRRGALCCFIRAKGSRRHQTGKWRGKHIRENLVLHEFTGNKYTNPDDILLRLQLPHRGLVFVERRRTFIRSLVEYYVNDSYI